eukprot:11164044-Alexandrium_andersonii.AAC.1
MQAWNVWGVRPVAECRARVGKGPIGGRRVDRNNWGSGSPNVRSRHATPGGPETTALRPCDPSAGLGVWAPAR